MFSPSLPISNLSSDLADELLDLYSDVGVAQGERVLDRVKLGREEAHDGGGRVLARALGGRAARMVGAEADGVRERALLLREVPVEAAVPRHDAGDEAPHARALPPRRRRLRRAVRRLAPARAPAHPKSVHL